MNQLIFVEESPSEGARHPVAAGITIGREGCEIVLADPEVSRRHAKIRALDDALAIEDLGSTNGTYVNGQRLNGVAEIKDGDAIKMGNSALRVEAQLEDGATRLTPIQASPPVAEPIAGGPKPEPPRTETAPEAAPPAAVAAPVAPAKPAAPKPAASPTPPAPSPSPPAPSPAEQATRFGQARGDVPAPPPASASRVHQAIRLTPSPPQHKFDAGGTGGTRRGSAATRIEATVISYAVVIATAVAVILYVLAEKF